MRSALLIYGRFQLLEWAHKYGEIYSLKLGGQDVVVLNTAEAANEILSRRSLNYATRTSGHVAHDILHDGMGLALLAYAPPWKVRPCRRGGAPDSLMAARRRSEVRCKASSDPGLRSDSGSTRNTNRVSSCTT